MSEINKLDTVVSGVIYALFSTDGGTRYIGYTIRTPDQRLSDHLRPSQLKKKSKKTSWIKSEGVGNISIRVLEYYPDIMFKDLLVREIKAIHHATTVEGLNLVNGTIGGDGCVGRDWTEEQRKNHSNILKGHPTSPETRLKISNALTGIKRSPETLTKLSKIRKGYKHTDESRRINSEAHKGLIRSDTHKNNISLGKKGKPNRGSHTRWHIERGIVNPNCIFC